MPLISLIITLVVAVTLLWLINNYISMDGKTKKILNVIVVICVFLWLLYAFDVFHRSNAISVPQVRQQATV